ncbi:MAG: glycosyltransferase, partial [Muribaculaceae bacterium]|nr:glycosyltransferase [Muribaculaceae bacterium]
SHERSRRGEPVNFLFLGAVARTKGILDLLDAIAAHKDELDGRFILHIGGCGPDDALADETIRKHNLGNLVVRHGWVTGEAKDRLIAASDVFILPSYAEGQPISLLESMAASMPAIVTPVGGIPELIDEGVNGVYCTPRDTESIFRAIFHFIEHPHDIETMGERNYIKVRPFFPAPTRDKLINLYTELCNREK